MYRILVCIALVCLCAGAAGAEPTLEGFIERLEARRERLAAGLIEYRRVGVVVPGTFADALPFLERFRAAGDIDWIDTRTRTHDGQWVDIFSIMHCRHAYTPQADRFEATYLYDRARHMINADHRRVAKNDMNLASAIQHEQYATSAGVTAYVSNLTGGRLHLFDAVPRRDEYMRPAALDPSLGDWSDALAERRLEGRELRLSTHGSTRTLTYTIVPYDWRIEYVFSEEGGEPRLREVVSWAGERLARRVWMPERMTLADGLTVPRLIAHTYARETRKGPTVELELFVIDAWRVGDPPAGALHIPERESYKVLDLRGD